MEETDHQQDQQRARGQLRELYGRHWPTLMRALGELPANEKERLSGPFLMDVFPEYFQAPKKLLVVGQQTRGWGQAWKVPPDEDPIEYLMGIYSGFHLAEDYLPTPFWGCAWQLSRKLNPTGPNYGYLWTNLFKFDQDARGPGGSIKKLSCEGFPVLPDEVKITAPDVVVILTGPSNDYWLKAIFPGLRFEQIDDFPALSRLIDSHGRLPEKSFRAYHPNYILRMPGEERERYYGRLLQALCDL
jgi:hypothetical protein